MLRTLRVGRALTGLGAQRPGAPPARRGSPFLPRNGEKGAGALPLDPGFYSPLAVARWFWGSLSLIRSRAIPSGILRPIWDAFFREICSKAFFERKFPNQGTYMGYEIAPRPEQCGTTAKTSECQRAGHKKGVQGARPRRSFLRLSPEKAGLPPGAGRETTLQVWTCDGPNGTTHRQPPRPPRPRPPEEGGPCHHESPSLRPDRAVLLALVCAAGVAAGAFLLLCGVGILSPEALSQQVAAWLGPEEAAAPAAAAPTQEVPAQGAEPFQGSFSPWISWTRPRKWPPGMTGWCCP